MTTIIDPPARPQFGRTIQLFSKSRPTFAERKPVSFPHPHRIPLAPDAAGLYAKYTERVLLPHYFPWTLNIIEGDKALAQETTILDLAGGCGHFLLTLCSRLPHFRSGR